MTERALPPTPDPTDGDAEQSIRWGRAAALAVAWLAVASTFAWFLDDGARMLAGPLDGRPVAQRVIGWSFYGMPYLLAAWLFLAADRRRLRGAPFSARRGWLWAIALTMSTTPGVAAVGNRYGLSDRQIDALRIIGEDFALGIIAARMGLLVAIGAYFAFTILGTRALARRGLDAGRALFLAPAAALATAALLSLVAALFLPVT